MGVASGKDITHMTNYPPPQGQPPYGQPPQGQPPYGQPQPYGQPGTSMAPQASNGWSIAALVTGIVGFCVPLLGGVLAIIFGILGIKRSGKTNTGKGMSIAGLILGIISLGIWALFGGTIWALVQGTAVNRDLAKQYINDLQSKNLTGAAAAVDSSAITAEQIQEQSDLVSAAGAIQDITTLSVSAKKDTATSEAVVGGAITFTSGAAKSFEMRQVKKGDKWVIVHAKFE